MESKPGGKNEALSWPSGVTIGPMPSLNRLRIRSKGNCAVDTGALWGLAAAAALVVGTPGCGSSQSNPEGQGGGGSAATASGGAGGTSTATGGLTSHMGGTTAVAGGRSSAGGSPTAAGASTDVVGGMQAIGGGGGGGGTLHSSGTSSGGGRAATGGATAAGGTGGTGGVAAQTGATGGRNGWTEQWATASPSRFYMHGTSPNAATSNVTDALASDGRALQLILGKNAQPSPSGGAEVGTNAPALYGTFSSRLRTADCTGQPNAGVVTGLFTYFNDDTDTTGDGIADNSEIDFEWLCAEPQTLYLTMWTDYRDSDAAQKRVSRAINLATGTVLHTCYYTEFGDCTQTLSGVQSTPSTIAPLSGYDSAARYYEYGFDWTAERVVWWMINPVDSQRIILWDYQGPAARITHVSADFLTNVWHSSDWPPEGNPSATASPSKAVSAWIDWTRYQEP